MKVKEYLINRILDLETDLTNVQMLREDIKDLNEMLDRYEMDKEHIKQIITCNINADNVLILVPHENDFKTLLAILDIKPEDYSGFKCPEEKIPLPPPCWGCKYEELNGNQAPCINCFQGDKKEVIPDAETKD